MPNHSFLLYVDDPLKSAEFYEKFLRTKPVEASPGFAMFVLNPTTILGLWKRADVMPKATAPAGCGEVGFQFESKEEVDKFFASSEALAITVLQKPTLMDFGYTFTLADPDGNRLRVFAAG